MSLTTRDMASHVRRLAETLATLRQRVREAVAGETGRAVGDAVRELLATALQGRPAPYRSPRKDWDDDRETWRDDETVRHVPTAPARWKDACDDTPKTTPSRRAAHWTAALAFAATAVRCSATRLLPPWVVFGLGTLAGVASWVGGDLAHAGLTLLTSVGELFPPSEPTRWGFHIF